MTPRVWRSSSDMRMPLTPLYARGLGSNTWTDERPHTATRQQLSGSPRDQRKGGRSSVASGERRDYLLIVWVAELPETLPPAASWIHVSAQDASMAPNWRRGRPRPRPSSGADSSTRISGNASFQRDLSTARSAPTSLRSNSPTRPPVSRRHLVTDLVTSHATRVGAKTAIRTQRHHVDRHNTTLFATGVTDSESGSRETRSCIGDAGSHRHRARVPICVPNGPVGRASCRAVQTGIRALFQFNTGHVGLLRAPRCYDGTLICKQGVTGSNPVSSTKLKSSSTGYGPDPGSRAG